MGYERAYLETLYEKYLNNPEDLSSEWIDFFKNLPNSSNGNIEISHQSIVEEFKNLSRASITSHESGDERQGKVIRLIQAYRNRGHQEATLDHQFPVINPDVDYAEDAPTDTFHIASGAQNVEAAKAFLLYVTSPEVQTAINAGDALGQLPVNANASVSNDKFIQQGFDMLSNNAGGGIMQFFDRDFPAEMASVGMEGLQEFMVFPDNLDDILERLEDARQRIYK